MPARSLRAWSTWTPAPATAAVPREAPGAAKLSSCTSEGNNYSGACFARRFAPQVAPRINTMLIEARWELVLSTAAGSQRHLESLRGARADLHHGSTELNPGLRKACEGSVQLSSGSRCAADSAQRRRGGAAALRNGPKPRRNWSAGCARWGRCCAAWKRWPPAAASWTPA